MFCGCSTAYDGAPPNSHTCPVCLGLPGALPTINRRAVEFVLATGAAIGATTPEATRWDRKNYFYPDLPKGYQISQYDLPLAAHGRLTVDTTDGPVTIGITRAHLEEDTAKLIHATDDDRPEGQPRRLQPLRRAAHGDRHRPRHPLGGAGPALRRGAPAAAPHDRRVRRRHGARPDARRGQRLDPRAAGRRPFGTRVEVKNMNSFRSVERAIDLRDRAPGRRRSRRASSSGQETRGWDDTRGATYVMRSKEDSHDYRYFPEPDLPPLRVDPAWLAAIRERQPELPADRRERYVATLGLSPYDARVIVGDPTMGAAFEAILAAGHDLPAKEVANLVTGDYARAAKTIEARTTDGLVGRPAGPSWPI